jgi:hypothetical protein
MLALLFALLFAPAQAQQQDMHVVPLPQDKWPASVVVDIPQAQCADLPGTVASPQRNITLCYIPAAKCASNAGWHVVERDAYRTGSARIAACRKTG